MVDPCLGGKRVLEWLVAHPERVATALMIGTTAASGAHQIGSHEAQIEAIRTSALFAVA
jgi:homoserine O-acetyltransferase